MLNSLAFSFRSSFHLGLIFVCGLKSWSNLVFFPYDHETALISFFFKVRLTGCQTAFQILMFTHGLVLSPASRREAIAGVGNVETTLGRGAEKK